jgi:hypothetical protein
MPIAGLQNAGEVLMYLWRLFGPLFMPSHGFEDYLRFGWWMLSLPLLATILMVNGAFFLFFKEGRRQRAIRTALMCIAVVLASDLAYYLQAVHVRATVSENDCRITSRSPHGTYDAVVCITDGTGADAAVAGFVRLRSTQDGSILARQEFYNPSPHRMWWTAHSLSVGIGEGGASFELPPSSWDRLLAGLP